MLAFPDHHSPSSIKQWRNAGAIWCLRYLFGWRDDGAPKMWRGSAVEEGLAAHLRGSKQALDIAYLAYARKVGDRLNEEITEQGELIEPMLNQAIAWHAKNPALDLAATQIFVEVYLDGVQQPFHGYVDFGFLDGFDLDLKTTEACPSKPRADDVRQIAIYAHKRERPQSLLYVTDKKYQHFTPAEDELEAAREEMAAAARSLETFLSVMPNRETALRCAPINDHYSVSAEAKAKLAELGV